MLSRVSAPLPALTLDDARIQLRLTADELEYDADLLSLLQDVQSMAETELRCGITATAYRETLSGFPKQPWCLMRGRVQAITSIQYIDPENTLQTLTAYSHQDAVGIALLSPAPPMHTFPMTARRPDAVTVDYVSGFGAPGDVPDSIKRWMKLHIGNWFANREAASGNALIANPFLDSLISEYRVWSYV